MLIVVIGETPSRKSVPQCRGYYVEAVRMELLVEHERMTWRVFAVKISSGGTRNIDRQNIFYGNSDKVAIGLRLRGKGLY